MKSEISTAQRTNEGNAFGGVGVFNGSSKEAPCFSLLLWVFDSDHEGFVSEFPLERETCGDEDDRCGSEHEVKTTHDNAMKRR